MALKLALEPADALRLIEPGPLALLTSRFRSADNVMAAAWMMAVSLDPPRIAVAIHPGRLTHEYVSKSEFFALNIPTAELLTQAHQCGLLSGQTGDKFVATGLTPVDAVALELPLVGECVAHIECGLVGRASFGDHDLFIGEPLAVTALDEAFNGRWLVEADAGRVLHHLRADYYASLARTYQAKSEPDER
jgi:flavin reductase (DIM6/NTAB) family NADH-FMN oxidoreductase RutF